MPYIKHLFASIILLAGSFIFGTTTVLAAAPQIQNLTGPTPGTVGQYQKIEWSFDLSKPYANPYYFYDASDTRAANPSTMTWVGEDGITVNLHVCLPNATCPGSGEVIVPAFYIEDYSRASVAGFGVPVMEALGKTNNGHWAARYAPSATGNYKYYFSSEDRDGITSTTVSSFSVTASSEKGFIHTSTKDPRFLAFDNGSSYIPIGAGHQFMSNQSRSYSLDDVLTKFGANNVNLFRLWSADDSSLAIEDAQPIWRKWEGPDNGNWAQGVEIVPAGGTNANVHTGLRSARPSTGLWYQRLVISEPAKPHRLTVWIKTDNVSGGQAQIQLHSVSDSNISLSSPINVTGTTAWTKYSATFTPGSNTVVRFLMSLSGTGNMYVDDVELGPDVSGSVAYNIVTDPGFERHFGKGNLGNDPEVDHTLNRPLGTYINQWAAYDLDKIVEKAQANGVAMQLCSCSGPWFTWPARQNEIGDKNSNPPTPYFWDTPWVINSWKRDFRYRVARWGYSPAVLGWEHLNETGHVNFNDTPHEWAFYQAYGAYETAADPYHHLRTTSENSQAFSPGLWSSNAMDIANYHWYIDGHNTNLDPDEAKTVSAFAWCLSETAKFGTPANTPYCNGLGLGDGSSWSPLNSYKPWVWGETGIYQSGTAIQGGEAGARFLHNIVWAGLFTPLGTTPLDWNQYAEDAQSTAAKFAARNSAGLFFANVDYAGGKFTYLMTDADKPTGYTGEIVGVTNDNSKARVYALRRSDKTASYLWIQHRDYIWSKASTTPSAISPVLTIPGLLNQPYKVESWDTVTGVKTALVNITPVAGIATLNLAGINRDLAVKIEAAAPPPTPVPGDVNGDGLVNMTDLKLIIANWQTTNLAADVNHDGKVNSFDFALTVSKII